MKSWGWIAAAICALAVGCGDDDGGASEIPAECNPLGGTGCVTPWPSALYQTEDSSTRTGMRLDIPTGALPDNADGVPIDPSAYNRRDGWSAAVHPFTAFSGGVDPTNLVSYTDYAASLTDASPTVIIDMSTNERVAHFAEVDANAGDDYDNQALYMRPAFRLQPNRRYAVGVRTSLKSRDGGELPMPEGFRKILDGDGSGHERLEAVRPRYEAIFASFEAAGIPKTDLVVAWDFTTASDEWIHDQMIKTRDAALASMGTLAANMTYTNTRDEPVGDGSVIARRINGTFTAPMVVTATDMTGKLARDSAGDPMVNGMVDAPYTVNIPAGCESQRPLPMLMFGHGFFGGLSETEGSYLRGFAAEHCIVVVGTVWKGMSEDDVGLVAFALNDVSTLLDFGERVVQGIINQMTLAQLLRGDMGATLIADGAGTWVDPSRLYFYGISQGHVLGSTFMAYDPSISRGVLQVGAGNWTMLFERSSHWQDYGAIVGGAYPGPLNKVILQSLMQMGFDPTDGIHVAARMFDTANPIPGLPAKQLLIQMAVGDSQVTNLATEHQARTMAVNVLSPALHVPYGMSEAAGPLSSALTIWDEKPTPLPPTTNELSGVDNGTHGSLRKRAAVKLQIDTFLRTGQIVHTCGDGVPCDCSVAGRCDPAD